MVSLNPTSVNIQTIVLGNILAIAPADILQLTIIGIVSVIVLFFQMERSYGDLFSTRITPVLLDYIRED